ncbi:MAG: sigma-54-dependent Fis family transcriptional regulator [Spirochaetaceae bacterium]|nr:MAG: sigma-54-dependent Fis family transcriptional regulator [Spirochaetaceae bacterium]
MSTVLIIDDEEGIRDVLSRILEDEGYRVFVAEDGIDGLQIAGSNRIDLVFLDVWLPNMGGIDVLKELRNAHPDVEVVVISGHANIDLAVKAVKLGAYDFLEKPLGIDRVTTVAKNALAFETLKRENRLLKNRLVHQDQIVGESRAFADVIALIDQSARSDSRVLIVGENGTGKELVAREIHRRSDRSTGPFVEVNCAAIPDTLLESELFGHEKGAFTSAVNQRRGKFETADGGTIFLDEIGDMSLSAQAKVLRVIQEMRFERVGGDSPIEVDVRVIAATNRDLRALVDRGGFREDLFFRLNVIPIEVPPLRDRTDDIPLLAEHFLNEFRRGDQPVRTMTPDAVDLLREYHWPGNVRELKNLFERISIMSDEELLTREAVQTFLGEREEEERADPLVEAFDGMGLTEARDSFEKRYLEQKLRENGFNVSRTATELGIYPSNLHAKIRKYGIQVER